MNIKLLSLSVLVSAAAAVSCKPRSFNSTELNPSESEIQMVPSVSPDIYKTTRFHLITPTGAKIFAAMKAWESGQVAQAGHYAQPAMCASNASRVLEMSGMTGYSSPLLMDMVNAVKKRGGIVITLPKNPTAIAEKLKTVFGGRIPVGSFVSGCLRPDCSGQAGDGHIALVGDIDSAGYIKIYHNNWYRPDNERDGKWRDYMIPLDWYKSGYLRKWMATPWVYLKRDNTGLPNNIQVRLPAIDDLDPTNYYVTLSIPAEIVKEVVANTGLTTDGKGEVKPYANSVPAAPSEPANLSDCGKVKVVDKADPAGVNLRSSPKGSVVCLVANGTEAERLGYEGQWMRVRAQCNGKSQEGFVFSFLTVSACQSEK
ncbi:MAG: hypothetical protein EBR09_02910 [Proteobacteria bacterium]|nr:hypothetical protein [Pseudomonadota bacterium]